MTIQEEILLDEYFPESAGQEYYSKLAARAARETSIRRWITFGVIAVIFIAALLLSHYFG